MRKMFLVLAFVMLFSGIAGAQSVEFGLRAAVGDSSDIRVVYSEYYEVQPTVVLELERRRLPADDISVLLFLSRQSRVSPEVVLQWRLAGENWWAITQRLRLEPAVYYVPVPDHVRPGPPYGKAYGYYRKHPRGGGKTSLREALRKQEQPDFDDNDIRNLVQLRLVSDYYGHRAEDVMGRRERGEDFGGMIRVEYEKKRGKGRLTEERKQELKQEKKHRKKHGSDDDDEYSGKGKAWKKYKRED